MPTKKEQQKSTKHGLTTKPNYLCVAAIAKNHMGLSLVLL